MGNLALTLLNERKYRDAEQLLRETMAIQQRVLGPYHPEVAKTAYNLACVRVHRSDHDEALTLLRRAIEHGLDQLDLEQIGNDTDLTDLHGDPRFAELISVAKSRAAAAK